MLYKGCAMFITNKIKAFMNLTGIKQIDIAKKLGTTQANISRIITKNTEISIEELSRIVEIAGGKIEVSIVLPDGTKL